MPVNEKIKAGAEKRPGKSYKENGYKKTGLLFFFIHS